MTVSASLAIPIPDPEQVPVALLAARRASGISQKEMARRAGVCAGTLHRWEEGEIEPSIEQLLAAFRACGYTFVALHIAGMERTDRL